MTEREPETAPRGRILVIKLGALGDFVLALGPFAAIRAAHPGAAIALLTTAPYAEIARASPYFDTIWIDERPSPIALGRWCRLRRMLRAGRFDRVYDLQTSDRSSWYFRLFCPGPRPEWSGIARGCSHPHSNPRRDFQHTLDRQAEQLAIAGIPATPAPDLAWASADIALFGLPERYLLLVPGGAAHRPEKRWPASHYAQLARLALGSGLAPIVLGTAPERPLAEVIVAQAPGTRSLAGATSLLELAEIARGGLAAIGNDTGPMHLIAAAGTPAVILFSAASDPNLTAPRGRNITILQHDRLSDLAAEEVLAALPG